MLPKRRDFDYVAPEQPKNVRRWVVLQVFLGIADLFYKVGNPQKEESAVPTTSNPKLRRN